MNCDTARAWIGLYVDGELPSHDMTALSAHLADCPSCTAELESTRVLVAGIAAVDPGASGSAPPDLWNRIEARLPTRAEQRRIHRVFHRPLAIAASLGLFLGAAVFVTVWLSPSTEIVHADAIDYRVLLDGLASNADASVNRFLEHYRAVALDPATIAAEARPMRFKIPDTLPGGFSLQKSYRLQFGHKTGYAASYRSETGEPVFAFFHPPCDKTLLGVHRESHCSVARGSHCVEVGPWQLIHFTDPTTCHCLLSRRTDEAQLREILAAISGNATLTPSAP